MPTDHFFGGFSKQQFKVFLTTILFLKPKGPELPLISNPLKIGSLLIVGH
jgi:hypothetical protein